MTTPPTRNDPPVDRETTPRRVRLPGFLVGEETGLGDAVTRLGYRVGIKPCDGCQRRAATLNRWLIFSR